MRDIQKDLEQGFDWLPCNECGHSYLLVVARDFVTYVGCDSCGARGPTSHTREQALTKWNFLRGLIRKSEPK
jgi:transcription elongation factor Elf1